MSDDGKEELSKRFSDSYKELLDLRPEKRIKIYESLSDIIKSEEKHRGGCNSNSLPLRDFVRENHEISKDGFIEFRQPRVFLSHSHKDKQIARKIYRYLTGNGISVWFDEAELRFGESLISRLREAIDSVDILLAVISDNSINSEWVKKEIEIAMSQEIDSKNVKVIPLLCAPVELPGFLLGKFYADLQTPHSLKNNLPKLASDINGYLVK